MERLNFYQRKAGYKWTNRKPGEILKALVSYMLKDYLRSYLYVPPVSLFCLWTFVAYTYVPNPVFSSYAVSCAVLYFVTAWLTITLVNREDATQLHITAVHARSFISVFLSKVIGVLIMISFLIMLAVLYPIWIGAFHRSVTMWDVLIAITAHFLISFLGVAVSLYFTKIWSRKTLSTWLLLVLILVISLVKGGIVEFLPRGFSFVTWVFPPSFAIMDVLSQDTITANAQLLFTFIHILGYASLLTVTFLVLVQKKNAFLS